MTIYCYESIYEKNNYGRMVTTTKRSVSVESVKELIELENYDKLNKLNFSDHYKSNDKIKFLPRLPNELIELDCSNNLLRRLPDLPPNLKILRCYNNILIELPNKLPKTLKYINCCDNRIEYLPMCLNDSCFINNLLSRNCCVMRCRGCENIRKINNYKYVCCYCGRNATMYGKLVFNENPVHIIINKKISCRNKFGGKVVKYFERQLNYKKFVTKIEEWFLECKYNPKYKYCRENLIMKDYNSLYLN